MADAPTTGPPAVRDRDLERHLREMNDALLVSSVRQHELTEQAQKSAAALAISEERLRVSQEAAQVGTFEWDMKTGVNVWTPALEALYGLAQGQFGATQTAWERLIHPDDLAKTLDKVERAINSGERVECEWRVIWPDGSLHWILGQFRCLKSATGEPLKLSGANVEVTERKQAQEVIRRLAAIVESSQDAIVGKTLQGTITSWNDGAEKLFGFSAEEIVGQPIMRLIPLERQAEEIEILARIARGERVHVFETVRLRKDGRTIELSVAVSAVRDASGTIIGASKVARDITERRQIEAALRVTNGLLRAATDNASVGLVSLDLERRYTFANPAYCKILGLPADIIGKGPAEMLPSVYAEQIAPSLDLAYAGQRVAYDLRRPVPDSADGKFDCFSVVYEPERDCDGNIIGVVVVIFDITERIWAEEKIRLLMGEVNHRAKNLLAVVQAIARQTARSSDPTTFAILLSERLRGLAKSQDLLIKNHWKCVELSELVHAQLSHFSDLIGSRLLFEGPSVSLSPGAAQGIGMALHELATNAAKYGALSNGVGRVRVNWDTGGAPEPVFTMQWLEEGGPEVAPPGRKGFGHQVIERMVEASVEGKVEIEYRKAGLFWKLAAPAAHLLGARGNER